MWSTSALRFTNTVGVVRLAAMPPTWLHFEGTPTADFQDDAHIRRWATQRRKHSVNAVYGGDVGVQVESADLCLHIGDVCRLTANIHCDCAAHSGQSQAAKRGDAGTGLQVVN